MNPKENNSSMSDSYEYELPSNSTRSSTDESLGESFFTHPSNILADIKPTDPYEKLDMKAFRPWYIACAVVVILGLIFEFGILGKDGKQGFLCNYLPKNQVCYVLAGPAPKVKK